MPTTNAGRNLGFAFIRFRSTADAERFMETYIGAAFGKKGLGIVVTDSNSIRQRNETDNHKSKKTRPTYFDEFGRIANRVEDAM